VKSVDVVGVARGVVDLEGERGTVVSGLVDAGDGADGHLLMARHFGAFRLFE
jgi:hypothetical protein